MEFKKIEEEALRIKELYSKYEEKNFNRRWNKEELFIGLVSDVGDLSRLIIAKEGMMKIENIEEKLEHEISDCLWSILVLAKEYNINVEEAFLKNMKTLEEKIKK